MNSFRRTLVGSKLLAGAVECAAGEFQTDPCGVEAARIIGSAVTWTRVSDGPLWGRSSANSAVGWTLILVSDGPLWGRSPAVSPRDGSDAAGFRRTLVGSKRPRPVVPRDIDAVSDGPLWGRSRRQQRGERCKHGFQTDPCGVEASTAAKYDCVKRGVSDGPLWGRSYL